MSERSCPVSGMIGRCPGESWAPSQRGPRGCSFSGYTQPGDLHSVFDIPEGVDVNDWLRSRERKSINDILYRDMPSPEAVTNIKNVDDLTANDRDLLAVALGAPARQVILRAQEVGPLSGWKDGFLTTEYGFWDPDPEVSVSALANCPGRVWSDLCERMPGCVSRGRVRESVAALPLVHGSEEYIPNAALWAAVVALGMLCSIYRYEEKNDGNDGVNVNPTSTRPNVEMSDALCPELIGIPLTIGLPYFQVSRRMGRAIPFLSFPDQATYNVKIRNPKSTKPFVGRFDNIDLRWPMFGERTEIAFLKGCAATDASFQHGPDAIAACQEAVMSRDVEALLREMIRLKEILERMPNAFHSISTNPNSGENYVSATDWVRWGLFSVPLSKRVPAASGLQFTPFLLMDAFLGRKQYNSFLGNEGLHLRAWLPTNLRAFIASVEYHYRVPEFVKSANDPRLLGVLDGIVEAYTGERGFMGAHRYKVFGILEVASKTGRTETNGASGGADTSGRPWELVHRQFSDAMKERLEPYRGNIPVEPHEMRGSFEECRYRSRILNRSFVDSDADRSIALVTLDLHHTGITFAPGDRLAVMPLNSWEECAKVATALGLDQLLDKVVFLDHKWARFAQHLDSTNHHSATGPGIRPAPFLTVRDVLRRGHLAPLTKELALKVHAMLHASSNTVLQVLATDEWPVRGSLGDLLQNALQDTPQHIWDRAFDMAGNVAWLGDLIPVEVPRTYSISCYPNELLPSTVDLTVSRSEYRLCAAFAGNEAIMRSGVSSGFLNPPVGSPEDYAPLEDEILVGVSRPAAFQLPIDAAAPCAYFAGGSGIAPFRSFWQARRSVGRQILFLGVQNREKFCYEDELRQHVNAGLMEVHLAFSRDSRGLEYDGRMKELVEKKTEPRYIDVLIAERGATVCDLVMSKAQGGLGGHLYICGSVAVFDSVMNGIRKAIWLHRTSTAESTDVMIDQAFAERRIMIDVFMTPKPLPCNLPTIPLSQLAVNTGHRPGGRIWLGVHGKVYDVSGFCGLHPGGTLIIKSNAGVDCSKSFDSLAHTSNPEVTSLLTKYFVGYLTPKPEYHGFQDISGLYDLWADYLRTTVETLVAHQFEMDDLMDSGKLWYQGNMINMLGVRIFYQYQSRLLQGGFSALFGPKLQELVLKPSFALADSDPVNTRLPDILGIIARAKTSPDAVATSKEVSHIGKLICNSESARFQERGIIDYANRSVQIDIELLEDIRAEACRGMDAFDAVLTLEVPASQCTVLLSQFLMQVLERMARRLEAFYSKLAQFSIYQPELEADPAMTRWNLVRRRVRDSSFFVLAQNAAIGSKAGYKAAHNQQTVEFDSVLSQIQQSLHAAPTPAMLGNVHRHIPLNERHRARTQAPTHGASEFESHENSGAMNRMSQFIDKNMRAMRRISNMPPLPLGLERFSSDKGVSPKFMGAPPPGDSVPTPPPSSQGSPSLTPRHSGVTSRRPASSLEEFMSSRPGLARRNLRVSPSLHGTSGTSGASSAHGVMMAHGMGAINMHGNMADYRTPPDGITSIQSMADNLNLGSRGASVGAAPGFPRRTTSNSISSTTGSGNRGLAMGLGITAPANAHGGTIAGSGAGMSQNQQQRGRASTSSLRSFKLNPGSLLGPPVQATF